MVLMIVDVHCHFYLCIVVWQNGLSFHDDMMYAPKYVACLKVYVTCVKKALRVATITKDWYIQAVFAVNIMYNTQPSFMCEI